MYEIISSYYSCLSLWPDRTHSSWSLSVYNKIAVTGALVKAKNENRKSNINKISCSFKILIILYFMHRSMNSDRLSALPLHLLQHNQSAVAFDFKVHLVTWAFPSVVCTFNETASALPVCGIEQVVSLVEDTLLPNL